MSAPRPTPAPSSFRPGARPAPTPSIVKPLAVPLHQRRPAPRTPAFLAIWTDGSVRDGRAAWSWIDNSGNYAFGSVAHGGPPDTIEAELWGLAEALRATPDGTTVHVNSDSDSALRCIAPYATVETEFGPAPDKFLPIVDLLADLCEARDVHIHWVKGHATDERNAAADELAALGSAAALRDKVAERTRIILDRLDHRLAIIPPRDCTCIPEAPEITWAKGHVDWSADPDATLASVAEDAFRRDTASFLDAARTNMVHATIDSTWAWLLLVRHQENEGTAAPAIVRELDSLVPGWRHCSANDLTLASHLRAGRRPPRWKEDWFAIARSRALRDYAVSGAAWLSGIRSSAERFREMGVGLLFDTLIPGWDGDASWAEIVKDVESGSMQVQASTYPDEQYLKAARYGTLDSFRGAEAWYYLLRKRRFDISYRITLNDALPGWESLSYGKQVRRAEGHRRLAEAYRLPWSRRIPENASPELTEALSGIESFIAAAEFGALPSEPGAEDRLAGLRALEPLGQLPEDLVTVLDFVAPLWRTLGPAALAAHWDEHNVDFALKVLDQKIADLTAGMLSNGRYTDKWLRDIRIAEQRGLLTAAQIADLDLAGPEWRVLGAANLDRVFHGLPVSARARAGDTEMKGRPALPVTTAAPEHLATVTALPSPKAGLVEEFVALSAQMAAVTARLDAEHPGWREGFGGAAALAS